MNHKKVIKTIEKIGKVLEALVKLILKIGTLVGVVKMVIDSLT